MVPLVDLISSIWTINIFGLGRVSLSTCKIWWNSITGEAEAGNRPAELP
ncbi:hypothetical protein KEJ25_06015 [Candidatus Bathyarchaeota archaeon]|nr:hypothetical protein [Candidatus Bathyarchaeota archaeon]